MKKPPPFTEEKRKQGRPSDYNEEVASKIIFELSTTRKGLVAICQADGMPSPPTVYRWIHSNESFRNDYARAKEAQAELLGEEILAISDDSDKDTIQTLNGEIENREWTSRSKLRVEARKWLMSKLHPKRFGDKLDIDANVNVTGYSVGFAPKTDEDEAK